MIAFYFQRLIEIFPFFLRGLWMTVAVSGLGLIFATILGFILGILRTIVGGSTVWEVPA